MSQSDRVHIDKGENDDMHASNGEVTITVLDGGRIFKRRAIKRVGSAGFYEICWIVAELDGVKLICDGRDLCLTKQDRYP